MTNLFKAGAGISQLEQFAARDGVVHRLHPLSKLITTMLYIVIIISFPSRNISGLIPYLFYPAVIMPLSDTPFRPLLRRLLIALPFSLLGGISNLIVVRSTAFYIGEFAISFGMVSFASVMLKTFLSVSAVLILISVTPFIEISRQLAVLHMPKVLCMQLVMTYRYISVLLDEAVTMFMAYSLRAPKQKGILAKDMGSFLGSLILRSFERAERVYQAMKCRGFQNVYDGKKSMDMRMPDYLYIVFMSLYVVILRFFNLNMLWISLAG